MNTAHPVEQQPRYGGIVVGWLRRAAVISGCTVLSLLATCAGWRGVRR